MKSVLSAIAIGILTLGVSGTASGQAEVWTASSNATGPVSRFDLDGNLLASFNSDSSLSAMIFTGTEVWTGSSNATGPVSRFDLDGDLLASFNSDSSLSAMIFTGTEVCDRLLKRNRPGEPL